MPQEKCHEGRGVDRKHAPDERWAHHPMRRSLRRAKSGRRAWPVSCRRRQKQRSRPLMMNVRMSLPHAACSLFILSGGLLPGINPFGISNPQA
jgi:hypothetical protein